MTYREPAGCRLANRGGLGRLLGTAAILACLTAGLPGPDARAQSDADLAALDALVETHIHGGPKEEIADDGHNHGMETAFVHTGHGSQPGDGEEATGGSGIAAKPNPFPSTYSPYLSTPTAIVGATVLTGTGQQLSNATVILRDGRIEAVGTNLPVPADATRVDGTDRWVTPGIIDIHSHLGVYPSPSAQAHSDGNEAISPNTANVWAEHSVWPQDPGFTRAMAGGITSLHILPGSANLFGGRGVTLKNIPSRTVQGMKFPDAPYTLKMACGENPKRVYGSRGRAPATRMGNVAGYREAWIKAEAYAKRWADHEAALAEGKESTAPGRDLTLETLAGVLNGEILVQMHCYRADEMATMLHVAEEFGYKITAFHHAVESYKIADLLRRAGTCSAMWADWWGFKLEAYDTVRENAALVHNAGACAIIHSDSDVGIQRLNQEAAKAMADGLRMGLTISRAAAITWITSNPARALGIYEETGSLEAGKAADVVVWNRDPFSVYAQADVVFIDGARLYDRSNPALSPRTDFELGQTTYEHTGGAGQ